MRKSNFTEAQIIGMIKEQEAGMPTAEVCRRHGLSTATFYKLKAKYVWPRTSERPNPSWPRSSPFPALHPARQKILPGRRS